MKHVYIIEAGNGHKKIGVASDVKKRMQSLRTGISTGIKSIKISDKFKNAQLVESQLHQANENIRLNGEWFDGELDLCGIDFNLFNYGTIIDWRFYITIIDGLNPMIELATEVNARQKLWDYMTRNMGNWNTITLMQSNLANELGMSRQHMNRIIKELESKKFIVKSGRSQHNNVYMLNPNKCWNGKSEEHSMGVMMFNKLLENNTILSK
jgi:hypothetical protein